jgi:hypothetical protein
MPAGRANADLDKYLDRIFEQNRTTIQEAVDKINNDPANIPGWGGINAKKWFKANMEAHMERTGDDVKKALEKLGRTEMFLTRTERRLNNIEKAIRSNPELLRQLRMVNGWRNKLDWDSLSITQDSNIYRMGNIVIDFRNSPVEVIFTKMPTRQDFDI